jgi:hypothetical protein
MANRTLVQNQLKMLYSIVQVKDRLACHVCGKSVMAVSLSEQFDIQRWTTSTEANNTMINVTHVKQCAVLIVAIMKNRAL